MISSKNTSRRRRSKIIQKAKNEGINDFIIPEYLKGIDWDRLGEELKLPSEQFWGLQWLRQRRAEKRAYFNFQHQYLLANGYKYKEKKGVYYYYKEAKPK